MKKKREKEIRLAKRLWQRKLYRARRAYMRLFGSTRLFDIHLKPLIRLQVFKKMGGSR